MNDWEYQEEWEFPAPALDLKNNIRDSEPEKLADIEEPSKFKLDETAKNKRNRRRIFKAKIENFLALFFIYAIVVLGVCLVVGLIALEIYVWATYGNKPAGEIPMWALWFMFGGGGS